MTTDVLSYLESKELDLYPAPNMNVRTTCMFHDSDRDAKEGSLYIKTDPDAEVPGLFFCHVCESKGSLNKIKRHFGDSVDTESAIKARKIPVQTAAAAYYYDRLTLDTDSLSYLTNDRGLSVETIERFQFGVATGDLMDYLMMKGFNKDDILSTGLVWENSGKDFFEPGTIIIPYFDQGNCVQLRGRSRTGDRNKYRTPVGQPKLLFNTDTILEADEIILTEGEFDACVLEDMGFNAVGVPGARQFIAEWAPFFNDIRKVFIAFDNERGGHGADGAEAVATLLGAKARIIEIPKHEAAVKIDISQYIVDQGHTKEDFNELLRRSGTGMLVTVREAFEKWLDREGNPNLTGLKLGLDHLDAVIAPGGLAGQVMVWLARTGTGKTVTMINLMQRMIKINPEIRILFVSLEQTSNEWFERARRIHGFYNPYLKYEEINEQTISYYEKNLLVIEKNRVNVEELQRCIFDAEDYFAHKIDLVVVDYLGYWARAFKGEPYVRTSDAIMALKEIAKNSDLFIMTPHQVNRGSKPGTPIGTNDARDSGAVEETADFLFSIGSDDYAPGMTKDQATGKYEIKILKSRHGGLNTQIDLQWCPVSLAYVPLADTLYGPEVLERALKEHAGHKYGENNYESMFKRHAEGDYDKWVYDEDNS